jgi:hypothetical protein
MSRKPPPLPLSREVLKDKKERDKQREKDLKLGQLLRQALGIQAYVSIELYDDKYHARIGDWHVDEGIADTPERALKKALDG